MSIGFFDYASVFLNSMCLLTGGIACAYIAMSTFFAKRHSPHLFFVYFILKMFAVAAVDTMRWFSLGDTMACIVGEIAIAAFGLLVIAVTYYTWDGSLVKIGLMGILVDFIAGFAMVGAVLASNAMFGKGLVVQYAGYLHPATAVAGCLMVAFFLALLQITKPLGRSFVGRSFKHEAVLLCFVFANIVFAATSRVWGIQHDAVSNFTGPFVLTFLCAPLAVGYFVLRVREARKRRIYLARAQYLMSACDDAVRRQSLFLEKSRTTLDGLAARIDRVEGAAEREDLRRYLDGLQSICDSLRFGTYSDNPVLDTVLLSYEEKFKAMGADVSFRVSPLATTSERVAIAAQELLEWAVRRMPSTCGERTSRTVRFRAFRRANAVFLELNAPLEHPAVSRYSWHARRSISGATVVRVKNENGMGTVCLMVEGANA
ncbi:MAG: hypothetical protein E7000_04175 [Coriobacteriaceae bacterium]|nr:hypothetical protein [Coriobacteriaceae bacterium]